MVSSSLKSRFSSQSKSNSSYGYGFWILIILLIVLIIGAIMSGTFYTKYENFTDNKLYTLQYYCMERCSHCNDFEKNVWTTFSNKVQNNPGYYHFDTVKYDITDNANGSELGKKYNITSTPTILLYNKNTGRVSNFNDDRTEAALIKFANNIIKSENPTWSFKNN
jgi:hypothetical protein